jgi:hypothetical protein
MQGRAAMRACSLHAVTSMIENGFVYLPQKASWLAQYLHELVTSKRETRRPD